MKKYFITAIAVTAVLVSMRSFGQDQAPNLDMFYGKKDLGGAKLGGSYCLTSPVVTGFADFYYLTKSKKSAHTENWPYYYGVDLEGAYAQGDNYHFPGKGNADFNAFWGLLWVDGRLYSKDTGSVRPYFDWAAGIGTGQIYGKGPKGAATDFDKSLNLFKLRGGAGVSFMISDKYSLDVGVDADGALAYIGDFFGASNMTLGGVQASVGFSKWTERR
jgi:hypothetical protein